MGATGGAALTRQRSESDQAELLGELERSLDDRGRLSMPSAFRWRFSEGAVVLMWPGPSVAILPLDEFRAMEENMRVKQRERLGDSLAREALTSLATHSHLDAAGRLFIPEDLRQHAGIAREVLVVGQMRRLELWAKAQRAIGADDRWRALVAHISSEAV